MINYYLELSMADKKLPITERMRDELCECCKQASNTVVARREKRTYSIIGRKDEYTLYMTLTSRNEVPRVPAHRGHLCKRHKFPPFCPAKQEIWFLHKHFAISPEIPA